MAIVSIKKVTFLHRILPEMIYGMFGILLIICTTCSIASVDASNTDACEVCDCSRSRQYFMNCSGRGLTKMVDNYPSGLQILDVSYNPLNGTSETDIFNGYVFTSLMVLDMSFTKVKAIPRVLAKQLSTLIMDGNLIQNMDNTAFENCPFLRVIRGLEVKQVSENAFSNIQNPLEELSLTLYQPEINENLFSSLKINNLTLIVPTAKYLPVKLFRFGTNYLTILTIIGHSLQELHEDLFVHLPILKKLEIFASSLQTLPNFLLHKENGQNHNMPVNLETVSIQGVKSLPRKIFHGQLSLKRLELHDIQDLPSNIFSSVTLDHLDLSGSGVYHIPPYWFKTLSSLEFLNLSKTGLESLNVETFRGLQSLTTLDISNNEMIDIGGSVFQDFRNTLMSLSIRNNRLFFLNDGVFKNMLFLENLDLSDNSLTSLQSDLFSDLTKLRVLSLNNNSLTTFPDDLLKNQLYLSDIFLSNNPIHCNCTIFKIFAKSYGIRVIGRCRTPKEFGGISMTDALKRLENCLDSPIQPSIAYSHSVSTSVEPESTSIRSITLYGSYSPETFVWYRSIDHKTTVFENVPHSIETSNLIQTTEQNDLRTRSVSKTLSDMTSSKSGTGYRSELTYNRDISPSTTTENNLTSTGYYLASLSNTDRNENILVVEPDVITNLETPEKALDTDKKDSGLYSNLAVSSFYIALIPVGSGCVLFGIMFAVFQIRNHLRKSKYKLREAECTDSGENTKL